MIVVERTFTVTTAPEPVLHYLRDFANTPQWNPAARSTTRTDSGPLGPGATWHQVYRIFGVTAELTFTLVTAEPGCLVFHGRNESATGVGTIEVRPSGPGAEVHSRLELEMHGLAKLATRMIRAECEKLSTESVERLAVALNALAGELHFGGTALDLTPPRSREAQA